MAFQLMRIFPTEQLQTPTHLIEMKRFDHGDIRLPSILLAIESEIKHSVKFKY